MKWFINSERRIEKLFNFAETISFLFPALNKIDIDKYKYPQSFIVIYTFYYISCTIF